MGESMAGGWSPLNLAWTWYLSLLPRSQSQSSTELQAGRKHGLCSLKENIKHNLENCGTCHQFLLYFHTELGGGQAADIQEESSELKVCSEDHWLNPFGEG